MGLMVVGIGEYKISANKDDIIKTYALGSCIAVIIYDRINKIAGLLHYALPESNVSNEKAKTLPGYFADTGIPLLIENMKKKGADFKNATIKIAGGASVLDEAHHFDIGKRNILACKKILWKYNIRIHAEDIGGNLARTVQIAVDGGEVILSNASKKWSL